MITVVLQSPGSTPNLLIGGLFKAKVLMLGRDVKSTAREPEDTALAIAALCVGGMVLRGH